MNALRVFSEQRGTITCSSEGGAKTGGGLVEEESRNSSASVAGLILNSSIDTLSSISGEPGLAPIGKPIKTILKCVSDSPEAITPEEIYERVFLT